MATRRSLRGSVLAKSRTGSVRARTLPDLTPDEVAAWLRTSVAAMGPRIDAVLPGAIMLNE